MLIVGSLQSTTQETIELPGEKSGKRTTRHCPINIERIFGKPTLNQVSAGVGGVTV